VPDQCETRPMPAARPVTNPVALTLATAVFDDCQLASALSFCVDPLLRFAVAVNCADAPTIGADPVVMTLETVGAVLGCAGAEGGAGADDDNRDLSSADRCRLGANKSSQKATKSANFPSAPLCYASPLVSGRLYD
jgi:hypothetical protein